MKRSTIIRAWTDKRFRNSLKPEDQARIPTHPAGFSLLTDDELEMVSGGYKQCSEAAMCCMGITNSTEPSVCMSDCWDCRPE